MTGEQKPGGLEVVASWDDLKALLDRWPHAVRLTTSRRGLMAASVLRFSNLGIVSHWPFQDQDQDDPRACRTRSPARCGCRSRKPFAA